MHPEIDGLKERVCKLEVARALTLEHERLQAASPRPRCSVEEHFQVFQFQLARSPVRRSYLGTTLVC